MDRRSDTLLWQQLSPRFDELLPLEPSARAERLAKLREDDAALADALAGMLDGLPALEAEGDLDAQALSRRPGLAGQAVGPYVLQHEIGQGGMGSVWLALRADGRYEGRVAIKFMRGELATPAAAARFLREGQLLGRLDHPHIARLLDAGVHRPEGAASGQPFLVLEHVEGQPIDRHCEAQGLDDRARVRLVLDVVAAVAHAHSHLILHRDLKPSNILVTADGRAKLLDFGIGKRLIGGAADPAASDARVDSTTATAMTFSTSCAAPEQVQQQALTTATDVYALGVLLYGLLGGGHPTEPPGMGVLSQLQAVVEDVPARLSEAVRRRGGPGAARRARALRGDMDTILARALKKDPAERYAHAAALAEDLRRWLDHEPVLARPDTPVYRLRRFMRRHARAVAAGVGAGALALTGGAALALWQAHEARHQRSQAEDLVEFMLRELEPRLNQTGQPELLQAVGARALAYGGGDKLRPTDDASMARQARALRVLGESARQRMDLAQARQAFDRAAAITAQLLALAPDDIQRLQEHATSLERLAELYDPTAEQEAVRSLGGQISSLRRRAAALAPDDPVLRLRAVDGDQWLAGLLMSETDPTELQAVLDRAGRTLQGLPVGLDGRARVQAIQLAQQGLLLDRLGRHAEAEASFRAFLAMQPPERGAAAGVWERREDRIVMRALMRSLQNQGRLAAAAELARQLEASLAAEAPLGRHNRLVALDLVNNRALIGETLWLGGAPQEARAQLRAIDAALAELGEVPADDLDWHLSTLGSVILLRQRLQPQAVATDPGLLAALQAHAQRLAHAEQQGYRPTSGVLGRVLAVDLALGDALAARHQPDQARLRWQAVADRALPSARTGDHPAMYHLAQAALRLGEPQAAATWAARLQAEGWRHPDLALLQQRLAQRSPTMRPTP